MEQREHAVNSVPSVSLDVDLSQMAPSDRNPSHVGAYAPAVGPRLGKLLGVVFVLVAVLGANSLYLISITIAEEVSDRWGEKLIYQNYFYHWMFLLHLLLGLVLAGPLVVFALLHLKAARKRPNRRAVRMGFLLFGICLVGLVTGFVLMRIEGVIAIRSTEVRRVAYWLHVGAPLAAAWLYVLHRLAGPRIHWRAGGAYGAVVALIVGIMVVMHMQDPRRWNVSGPTEGEKYFFPSLARTATGDFIPARSLMMDKYCRECHADAYEGWFHSAHRFSSFNNPAYLFSVRETRKVALKRDGSVKASRFCAGCHDPVPFFSGAFDHPDYDDEKDPTAHAGVTCVVCHGITHINSTRGNADFTIDEPAHYPLTFSDDPFLKFVNRQLIKSNPALHKKTFLKPLHKSAEFCSACHKVHLPYELTHYKEFLRGQNHYDSFILSGVSGGGARSFYYPDKAQENCNGCHMPLLASSDFGAKKFDLAGPRSIHDHLFVGANTAVPHWQKHQPTIDAHQDFLEGCLRVDLFGFKQGDKVGAPIVAPLRPEVPALERGKTYLLEAVIRTLTLGHHFTQGTTDSNQVWVELAARSGGRIFGRSGGMDADGEVDRWSHFVNNYMLDRHGKRIDRRNAQDIFVPLYDHQIPPGAAQVVHYRLTVPEWITAPITVEVHVRYRKFDLTYMRHVFGEDYRIDLPVTTLASDKVVFPVAGLSGEVPPQSSAIAEWRRWNDYGIGLFLEGQRSGTRGEIRQAADAFRKVEELGRFDGPLNLARVHLRQGMLALAATALERSQRLSPPAPPWTVAYFSGQVHKRRGEFDAAVTSFRSVLQDRYAELRERMFDVSRDYVVNNELGLTLFEWAKREENDGNPQRHSELLKEAITVFHHTLTIDSENLAAHHNLALLYEKSGDDRRAAHHARLRDRYRPDDTARGRVSHLARRRDLAANHAAEAIVIYPLHRSGAPGLPAAKGLQQ